MSSLFNSVPEGMAFAAQAYPAATYTFQDMHGSETVYTYGQLYERTARVAAGLQQLGMRKGDRLGLILIEPEQFVVTYLAALRAGIVPVPMYPPDALGGLDGYMERTGMVLQDGLVSALVMSAPLQPLLGHLRDAMTGVRAMVRVSDLEQCMEQPVYPCLAREDLAFLQYTSGSTAAPKGVMVTHGSLLANAHAIMVEGLHVDPARDVGVSWLPLYHDMGLIGFVVAPVLYGISTVYIPTMRFIKKPAVWMDTIHEHRGTITFAPNFALSMITQKAHEEDLRRWDLSCLRVVGCGAEPISAAALARFEFVFHQHCGMPHEAILPCYGMAESTLAVTFKPHGQRFSTRRVSATVFQQHKRSMVIASQTQMHPFDDVDDAGMPAAVEHVSCGVPFSQHELMIVNADQHPVPECEEGEIWIRGPSVTAGYFGKPEASAQVFQNGWLRTGDLGYLADGQLYVTGRIKDLIIINGRNIHPQEVEWAASAVDGVRKGNVVAFSVPQGEHEAIIVALETRHADETILIPQVKRRIHDALGLKVEEVVCLAPGMLPKTSSGKLQRYRARQMYLAGELGRVACRNQSARAGAVHAQVVRHVARSMWSRLRAHLHRFEGGHVS